MPSCCHLHQVVLLLVQGGEPPGRVLVQVQVLLVVQEGRLLVVQGGRHHRSVAKVAQELLLLQRSLLPFDC